MKELAFELQIQPKLRAPAIGYEEERLDVSVINMHFKAKITGAINLQFDVFIYRK